MTECKEKMHTITLSHSIGAAIFHLRLFGLSSQIAVNNLREYFYR